MAGGLKLFIQTQTTIDRCNRLFNALREITAVEQEERLELDGRTPQDRCTRGTLNQTYEEVHDAIFRNLFPRATVEQRNALFELCFLRDRMDRVPAEGLLTPEQMEIQHAHEAAKARVRYHFPLDEIRPMQAHWLETVLLK